MDRLYGKSLLAIELWKNNVKVVFLTKNEIYMCSYTYNVSSIFKITNS